MESFNFEGLSEYAHPLWKRIGQGIDDDPLYRQTIKKVLSSAAYAVYSTVQQERKRFWLAAKCQVVLASLDLNRLLS